MAITWYRTHWSYIPLHIYSPKFCGAAPDGGYNTLEGRAGGAAPAVIQYSPALDMQGHIAGATPLSQLSADPGGSQGLLYKHLRHSFFN